MTHIGIYIQTDTHKERALEERKGAHLSTVFVKRDLCGVKRDLCVKRDLTKSARAHTSLQFPSPEIERGGRKIANPGTSIL
jgi:hypothetical protein